MSLTILQILEEALLQGQLDNTFLPQARRWYNRVVLKMAQRHDFNFYRKNDQTNWISGQSQYDLPSDFLRSDSLFSVSATGSLGASIPIVDSYIFDANNRASSSSGVPSMAYINRESKKLEFNSTPANINNQQSFRLYYFKTPKLIDVNGADDADASDFEDQETLIEELVALAWEFDDDERQTRKKQEAAQANALYQRNNSENDGTSQMHLNQNVFRPTSRRFRRRGFNS